MIFGRKTGDCFSERWYISGKCDGFRERCRFWRSAVVLRGSVVSFAGKWCISGGSIAALGRSAEGFWGSSGLWGRWPLCTTVVLPVEGPPKKFFLFDLKMEHFGAVFNGRNKDAIARGGSCPLLPQDGYAYGRDAGIMRQNFANYAQRF